MQLESSLVQHALEIEWWGDAIDAVEQVMENMTGKLIEVKTVSKPSTP